MKSERFVWAMLAAMLMVAAAGAQSANATSGFYDYEFTVDTSSQLSVYAYVSAYGFSDSDLESTYVSGSMCAKLDSIGDPFSEIQITVLDLAAMNTSIHMEMFDTNPLVTAWVNANNLKVLMGNGYGTVGDPTDVISGEFEQTGNEVQASGTAEYKVYVPIFVNQTGTVDLDETDPEEAILEGTVTDNGSTITLSIVVDMTIDLTTFPELAPYLDEGYVDIDGTIIGTAVKPLLGDADGDIDVDLDDLGALADHWGASSGAEWAEGDFDLDGDVDLDDLGALADNWGATGSVPPMGVPEPATMSLLGLGGLALLRRRK